MSQRLTQSEKENKKRNSQLFKRTTSKSFPQNPVNKTIKVTYIVKGNKNENHLNVNSDLLGNSFSNNNNVEIIKFSGQIDCIVDNAFENCSELKEIHFSHPLQNIGTDIFRECNKLTKLVLPNYLTTFENTVIIKEGFTLTSFEVPSSVQKIGDSPFNHGKLYELKIPSDVEKIDKTLIKKLKHVTTINFETNNFKISVEELLKITNLKKISFPYECIEGDHNNDDQSIQIFKICGVEIQLENYFYMTMKRENETEKKFMLLNKNDQDKLCDGLFTINKEMLININDYINNKNDEHNETRYEPYNPEVMKEFLKEHYDLLMKLREKEKENETLHQRNSFLETENQQLKKEKENIIMDTNKTIKKYLLKNKGITSQIMKDKKIEHFEIDLKKMESKQTIEIPKMNYKKEKHILGKKQIKKEELEKAKIMEFEGSFLDCQYTCIVTTKDYNDDTSEDNENYPILLSTSII